MRNVHIGWGPVGMTRIKTQSKPKLQLNKVNYTGKLDSEFKLNIISDYEVTPVWQSSNEDVVKVDQDGNITLIGEGTAVITVTSGELIGKCTIKVVLSTEQKFLRDIAVGGTITLSSDVALSNYVEIRNEVVINLNGHSITPSVSRSANHGNVFEVLGEGKLTINGKGSIIVENGYCIYAAGNSNVILNGGYYFSPISTVDARENAIVTINGGEFKVDGSNNPDGDYGQTYTLNLRDKTGEYENELANIIVKGGEFYNFNPANNTADGPNTNYVANGYEAIETKSGIWEVSKIKSVLDSTKIYYGVMTPSMDTFSGYSNFTEDDFANAIKNGTLKSVLVESQESLTVSLTEFQALVILIPTNSKLKAFKSILGKEFEFAEKNTTANLHSNGKIIVGDFRVYGELFSVFNSSAEYIINIHE